PEKVQLIARDFFQKLGEIGREHDVIFCIEPNPEIYSCNFITHSLDAYQFVREINHPAIKMQLDTGTIVSNNEDFKIEIPEYKRMVGHIHLSTTQLMPISMDKSRLNAILNVIKSNFSDTIITIEMRESPEIFESLLYAKKELYG